LGLLVFPDISGLFPVGHTAIESAIACAMLDFDADTSKIRGSLYLILQQAKSSISFYILLQFLTSAVNFGSIAGFAAACGRVAV
jgi:hypothetical protein